MAQYPNAALGVVPPGPSGPFGNIVGQYARPLRRGESIYLFGVPTTTPPAMTESNVTFEEVAVGEASIAVCIATGEPANSPPMICVEGHFDSAPGAFELDIQEADTDADSFYILPANGAYRVTAVVAATNDFRVDLSPTGGKFMRVFMAALANDADFWCKISRLA
jgi:hypothetical protein